MLGIIPLFFVVRDKDLNTGNEDNLMKNLKFTTLSDCIECYGRSNLVAIDNLSQIFFYTAHGCQPKFVFENECKRGKITCWFLKEETNYVYKKWMENAPNQ